MGHFCQNAPFFFQAEDGIRDSASMVDQIALSAVIGAPVYDESGTLAGHVREVAISPREDSSHISDFVVKTSDGDRLLPVKLVSGLGERLVKARGKADEWPPLVSSEGL